MDVRKNFGVKQRKEENRDLEERKNLRNSLTPFNTP